MKKRREELERIKKEEEEKKAAKRQEENKTEKELLDKVVKPAVENVKVILKKVEKNANVNAKPTTKVSIDASKVNFITKSCIS